ncbi:ABC transporter ATP-binding protein [Candidatus Babela massiliensis]|uniref:ABC-type multidrug transport system ATPase and permease component n=1 Tax=Candidatus Babela massiliensis TaxID=673862 RepID=V6DGU7_9BACT|nr:ABC transporter ATP-binding protein [Candidatus Babela massiliensis]CDK30153.1 ABC-type multidrug transport system ATPase and permease component [Candidatus Babela massiliensis]
MNTLRRIINYAQINKFTLFIASIFSAINKIIDVFPDLLIGMAVDIVVNQEASFLSNFGILNPRSQIITLGIITAITYILESLTELVHSFLWRKIAQDIQHNIRVNTYNHLQSLEIGYFEDKSVGNLLNILVDDINLLEQFFNDGANDIIKLLVSTLTVSAIFFYISPTISLFAFSSMPIILFITSYFQNQLKKAYFKARQAAGKISSLITHNILGLVTIKAYTAEEFESKNIEQASDSYRNANKISIIFNSIFSPIIRIAIMGSYIVTLVLGGLYVLDGTLAVGSYSILVFLTQRLLWPFADLAWLVDLYERAMTSGRRILDIAEVPVEITDLTVNQELVPTNIKGHIIFDSLSFTYPNGKEIFKDLYIEILPGQTIAFVGSTGSGKSTIVKLLLRFYDISQGKILIDGTDINSVTKKSLRETISLVSQELFLVPGTIYDNIAYGQTNATLERVVKAAKMAQAYNFIMALPEQFNTIVSQSGLQLSGGQKQRLSIARAILKNAPIFVFDEATSALDNETERAIQISLEAIEEDHTTIIIAHRLSTIRNADKIFVLDNGTIIETGKHDELIERNGIYARLWKLQTGETF